MFLEKKTQNKNILTQCTFIISALLPAKSKKKLDEENDKLKSEEMKLSPLKKKKLQKKKKSAGEKLKKFW